MFTVNLQQVIYSRDPMTPQKFELTSLGDFFVLAIRQTHLAEMVVQLVQQFQTSSGHVRATNQALFGSARPPPFDPLVLAPCAPTQWWLGGFKSVQKQEAGRFPS